MGTVMDGEAVSALAVVSPGDGGGVTGGVPIGDVGDRAHNVSKNGHRADARSEAWLALGRLGRNNLRDGMAEAGDEDGLTGLFHLLEDGEAGGLEFGNGDFFHGATPSGEGA